MGNVNGDFEKYIDSVLQKAKIVAMEEAKRSTSLKVTIEFSQCGAKISYDIDRIDYIAISTPHD